MTSRELITHPLVLGATADLLHNATVYQLHLTQVISVLPGETDFTEQNGATRIVPGSHLIEGKQTYADDDPRIVRAEMERGSMFFYSGKVYHGAAANNSRSIRQGINLTYCVGWVRQEENQYLSTPIEAARTLDENLLKLMGYQMGGLAVGYIRDFEDPLAAIRDDMPKKQYEFAALTTKTAHLNSAIMDTFHEEMVNAESPVATVP